MIPLSNSRFDIRLLPFLVIFGEESDKEVANLLDIIGFSKDSLDLERDPPNRPLVK